jgi:isopentenyl-diphosphate delta-isomerase
MRGSTFGRTGASAIGIREPMSDIGNRKTDHLTLCARGDVGFRGTSTLLEEVRLLHDAMPELDERDIDTTVTLFGKRLRAPILIAAMTGGTDEAARVNRELAKVAEARGYAFGLGSQRAMLVREHTAPSFRVREVAPTALLFGNLGLVQARTMTPAAVRAVADDVQADAICIHLNPAMELVQPEGDRDFSRGVETLRALVEELPFPVIGKETGNGLSRRAGEKLQRAGIRHVDVSGAGGTSWVGVETKRAEQAGDRAGEALGEALWDWGIPTAASVATMRHLGMETVIATGGVQSGGDVARAIALGASVAGLARPVLKALYEGGPEGVHAFFDRVERELRAHLLLTGSRDVAALRSAPRLVGPTLRAHLEADGVRLP